MWSTCLRLYQSFLANFEAQGKVGWEVATPPVVASFSGIDQTPPNTSPAPSTATAAAATVEDGVVRLSNVALSTAPLPPH